MPLRQHGDGFVVSNSDGIAGVVSANTPEPRAFATDMTQHQGDSCLAGR